MAESDYTEDCGDNISTSPDHDISDWVVRMLNQEPPPSGIPQELIEQVRRQYVTEQSGGDFRDDLYTLQAELTKLSQETKLQGRSFKSLSDNLAPLCEKFEHSNEYLTQLQSNLSRIESALHAQAESGPDRELLEFLVDLRDRLRRGMKNAQILIERDAAGGFWSRFFRRPQNADPTNAVIKALVQGYQLTLEYLEESLTGWGVSEIPCEQQRFDPSTMKVVDIVEAADLEDGSVVTVYRTGYRYHDQVLRLAEVKVVRNCVG